MQRMCKEQETHYFPEKVFGDVIWILQETIYRSLKVSCNECEVYLPFWIQVQLGALPLDLFKKKKSPKAIDPWLIMSTKK